MNIETPGWFRTALERRPRQYATEVDGCRISYRCWGEPERPGIILVHGGAAHAGWWDHIAPLIDSEYRVVAIDMSGHGDSGRRDDYSLQSWAAEIVGVAEHAQLAGSPIVIGHSMGGWASIMAAARYPERISGIVILDAPVADFTPEERAARERTAFGPLRVYPTVTEALARFRTVPDQPNMLPYVVNHVARSSMGAVEGGWTWKFDPGIFRGRRPSPQILKEVRCRVALFRAEHGLITPDIGIEMYELLGRVAPVIEIPLAGHHLMLDQPLLLVTGIRTLLADWQHSVPQTRPKVGTNSA
ncbi:alpha/beta fold hydrolase [Candidatus Protofrankia californiensis]|uniref:alpha/beta fold hydrolase n=1 Tax=Candidatus Protofrankia californiensis TaxID=1839754 RepID=UPI00104185D5|nr:alpha/beta hydrolase [Candidatus Protofrankia californiensis]